MDLCLRHFYDPVVLHIFANKVNGNVLSLKDIGIYVCKMLNYYIQVLENLGGGVISQVISPYRSILGHVRDLSLLLRSYAANKRQETIQSYRPFINISLTASSESSELSKSAFF